VTTVDPPMDATATPGLWTTPCRKSAAVGNVTHLSEIGSVGLFEM
jgi:hypothetical protein